MYTDNRVRFLEADSVSSNLKFLFHLKSKLNLLPLENVIHIYNIIKLT